ncbi:MAG: hypothetical protein SFW36_15905, partial [Leptolyngbyaceae cyanobacterium bins.59]|nr:hypothetical protein [Leptolyngbyaceae cyanobacterium bins.59]
PIIGQEAIVAYLEEEATGMALNPREGRVTSLSEGYLEVQVGGQVQTSWFGINVAWMFILNPHRQIERAGIKLLASPEELLNIRR